MIIKNAEEGYIKFICHFDQVKIDIRSEIFAALNYWRNYLYQKGWIGVYPDGIGFGNISMRVPGSNQFIISGSATGEISELEKKHYALVEKCDVEKNMIWCRGMVKASSESMTHYTVYNSLPEVNAVVHIHNIDFWEKYLNKLPTTSTEVAYGTPDMAYEIESLLKKSEALKKRVIIMGGHREGIISFGKTMEEAAEATLSLEEL